MSVVQSAKAALNLVHERAVFGRRVRVLAGEIAAAIPTGGDVLDLGAGDGSIAAAVMAVRPDLKFSGVDVMLRPVRRIEVALYDGKRLPFADQSFDYVTIIDVLHHTEDPAEVLAEAARVARLGVVVKDHRREGILAGPTLRLMDWVGNRGHDVVLPYNYLSDAEWDVALDRAGLSRASETRRLGLYPVPFGWVFDRGLHFIARLVRTDRG
jgi:SAM-dependent methyltransferase